MEKPNTLNANERQTLIDALRKAGAYDTQFLRVCEDTGRDAIASAYREQIARYNALADKLKASNGMTLLR